MQVRYFLHAVPARVRDHPEAVGRDALHLADLRDGAGIVEDLGVRGVGGEIVVVDVFAPRDHQHMDRRLRADVVEGETVVGLEHGVVGDLSAQDLREDVVF